MQCGKSLSGANLYFNSLYLAANGTQIVALQKNNDISGFFPNVNRLECKPYVQTLAFDSSCPLEDPQPFTSDLVEVKVEEVNTNEQISFSVGDVQEVYLSCLNSNGLCSVSSFKNKQSSVKVMSRDLLLSRGRSFLAAITI